MGLKEVENLKRAVKLFQEIKGQDFRGGCIETSLTALGGNIPKEDVFERFRIIDRENHTTFTYLDKHGLVPVAFIQFDAPPSPEEISEIINNPKYPYCLCGQPPPSGYIKGFIMEMLPSSPQKKGHAVAIIHRDGMLRKNRKLLKADNRHIMIDAQRPELITEIDDISLKESIESLVDRGYEVTLYFLRRKRH